MGADGFETHLRAHFWSLQGVHPLGDHDPTGGAADTAASKAFESVHAAFDWLPLAAMIEDSVLVLHGGIGNGTWGITDLRDVPRPLSDEVRRKPASSLTPGPNTQHSEHWQLLHNPL